MSKRPVFWLTPGLRSDFYDTKYTSLGRDDARVYTPHAPLYNPRPVCEGGTHRGHNILGIGGKRRVIGRLPEGLRDQAQLAIASRATLSSCARPERRSGVKSTGEGALWPFPCWCSAPWRSSSRFSSRPRLLTRQSAPSLSTRTTPGPPRCWQRLQG